MKRRELLAAAVALVAGGCLVRPHPMRHHARVRRRVRRRIRRRYRRRVAWRVVTGRRVLVVPTAVVVGWELSVDNRVHVVREVRPDVIVLVDSDGKTVEHPIEREDTAENGRDEPGSIVAAGDPVPAREADEEVEEDD